MTQKKLMVPPLDHLKQLAEVVANILKYDTVTKRIRATKCIIVEYIGDKRDLQVLVDRGFNSAKDGDTEYSLPQSIYEIDICIEELEKLIKHLKEIREE